MIKQQKGRGKTIMEQISDNGLFNKDYPDINDSYNYSKESQSAFKILNSKNNTSLLTIKGGKTLKSKKKSYKKKKKSYKNKNKSKSRNY
jgi:hypothetical protein